MNRTINVFLGNEVRKLLRTRSIRSTFSWPWMIQIALVRFAEKKHRQARPAKPSHRN